MDRGTCLDEIFRNAPFFILCHTPPLPVYWLGWRRLATALPNMPLTTRARQPGYVPFFCFLIFFIFFLAVSHSWRSSCGRSFFRGGEPLLRTRGNIAPRSVYGQAPTRQLHSTPIAVSGSGHAGEYIDSIDAVIHTQARLTTGFQEDAAHPSCGLPNTSRRCAWCKQVSAWLVKTRRAPSRHCKDARVYGRTTTAMHDIEYTPRFLTYG